MNEPEDMILLHEMMMADPKVQATLKAISADIKALMERDFPPQSEHITFLNPEQQSFAE